MSDHYDRYNGMENLLGTNLAEVGTDVHDINVGELISRQAAIGIVEFECGEWRGLASTIVKAIEQLPSAQPTFDARDTQYNLPIGTDCISRQAAIDRLTEYGNGRAVFISVGEAVIRIEQLPSVEPKTGKWILDRSGAYCCSECMEPCAGYVMMRPRDRFCKMCGAKMEE